MQTFLPVADFYGSALILDKKRSFAQLREADQIIKLFDKEEQGNLSRYRNHPAVRAWRGYKKALSVYYNIFLEVCILKHNIKIKAYNKREVLGEIVYPLWFGYEPLHSSHRSRLLQKYPEYYSKYNWVETPGGSEVYVWPVDKEGNLLKEIQEGIL